jgi:hypothetical protein
MDPGPGRRSGWGRRRRRRRRRALPGRPRPAVEGPLPQTAPNRPPAAGALPVPGGTLGASTSVAPESKKTLFSRKRP